MYIVGIYVCMHDNVDKLDGVECEREIGVGELSAKRMWYSTTAQQQQKQQQQQQKHSAHPHNASRHHSWTHNRTLRNMAYST